MRERALGLMHNAMTDYLGHQKGCKSGKMIHDPLALAVALDEGVCTLVEVELGTEENRWGSWLCQGSGTWISVDYDETKFRETLLDDGNQQNLLQRPAPRETASDVATAKDRLGKYKIVQRAKLQSGNQLNSPFIGKLELGTVIEVVEVDVIGKRVQGRVEHPAGWLSLRTKDGNTIWAQPCDLVPDGQEPTSSGNAKKEDWMCSTAACRKPSWNSSPGEYCSRSCRDGPQQAMEPAVNLNDQDDLANASLYDDVVVTQAPDPTMAEAVPKAKRKGRRR